MQIRFYFIILISLLISCKGSEDTEELPTSTPLENCCQIPHVQGCISGAKFYVPNAFTPNNDGLNDLLIVRAGLGIERIISFKIKNQTGELVHEATEFSPGSAVNFGWNGRGLTEEIIEGVYTYEVSVANIRGEISSLEGSVCSRTSLPMKCLENGNDILCSFDSQRNGDGEFESTVLPEPCE